ncbi:flagellar hook-associated protein FlgK [Pseudorhodobacter sp. W20_MBD10_FR17]|uniref:flagellar hook-associated protein FlgK n=1 Tax=Pseudorhodobacter sp. W20_MBD10_FR17 TaxID=3240266 RepID=UPI003F9650DF
MSISGSMSSALSGLTAAARSAELISSNIANALTDGYGRRELQVSAQKLGSTGQGVHIVGVSRDINQALVADRRIADASASNMGQRLEFLTQLSVALGSPEEGSSLSGRLASFDSALIAAAAEPESSVRQGNVVETARSVASGIRSVSTQIQSARAEADAQIATEVGTINSALVSIAKLNTNIASTSGGGQDISALLDQRQQLIDKISAFVPLREIPRENGKVALYTTGGAALLDGLPATLGFSSVNLITPDMTLASGALSGLTINGRAIDTGDKGTIAGGSLAANFAIRDDLAPAAQAELDAVARDLITRFQDPAVDTTLLATDAGLFTDGAAAFSALNEDGVAARIGLNAAVDPSNGGAVWRVRDGIGATSPGLAGDSTLFSAMQTALNGARTTATGQFAGGQSGAVMLTAKLMSSVASDKLTLETETGFASARATALYSLELEGGVDTDSELQDLLLVEQAYAANAKVIQTADDMLQILLGM